MVARFLVLQYDNRLDALTPMMVQNRDYCSRHGYEYMFVNTPHNMPPYWIKVWLAAKLLKGYAGVLWLDSDACVYDASITLESLLAPKKSFYMAPDNAIWKGPFNAGVWLVLNTPTGRRIMREWIAMYDPTIWQRKPSGKWITSGRWAGPAYEQGSFTEVLLPKYADAIRVFDWKFLQSTYANIVAKDRIFTLHFAGVFGKEMALYENTGVLKKRNSRNSRKTRKRRSGSL
jgi:hypothetical protein